MQEHVYRTPIFDVADLKRRLIVAWSGLHSAAARHLRGNRPGRGRLRACVRTDGRHFEHLL